jgi:hypothetical protein
MACAATRTTIARRPAPPLRGDPRRDDDPAAPETARMRKTRLVLAATAVVGLAGCGRAPGPPPVAPVIRCIEIPNGLAECSEVAGPAVPGRAGH